MSVQQVQVTARDYYVLTKGVPLGAAIALVSVLYHESKLNPGSQGRQSTEHGGILNRVGAYGIASWNGPEDQSKVGDPLYDRQAALLGFATKHNLPVDALLTQLAFVLTEIANGYSNCWAAIRSTASYQSIITILTDEYEIPANKAAEINDSLAIAGPLAALPPPAPVAVQQVPAPQAPVATTQVPATVSPLPQTPAPVTPAGPPSILPSIAGLDAAILDHFGAILDALTKQRDAINVRISKIEAQAADFATLEGVATSLPPLLQPPSPPPDAAPAATTQGNTMPTFAINWKTTISGIIAAAGALSSQFPPLAPYSQLITALGTLALGFTAKDAGVTGGTKSAVTGATVATPVSLIAK